MLHSIKKPVGNCLLRECSKQMVRAPADSSSPSLALSSQGFGALWLGSVLIPPLLGCKIDKIVGHLSARSSQQRTTQVAAVILMRIEDLRVQHSGNEMGLIHSLRMLGSSGVDRHPEGHVKHVGSAHSPIPQLGMSRPWILLSHQPKMRAVVSGLCLLGTAKGQAQAGEGCPRQRDGCHSQPLPGMPGLMHSVHKVQEVEVRSQRKVQGSRGAKKRSVRWKRGEPQHQLFWRGYNHYHSHWCCSCCKLLSALSQLFLLYNLWITFLTIELPFFFAGWLSCAQPALDCRAYNDSPSISSLREDGMSSVAPTPLVSQGEDTSLICSLFLPLASLFITVQLSDKCTLLPHSLIRTCYILRLMPLLLFCFILPKCLFWTTL